ncbi:MAG: DNA-formamidopyrimidine glycosylase family protein [Ilumatobacteraceae bacterium]
MPEGDTLRRLATKIDRRFAGAVVERSVTRDPRLSGVDLAGRTLVDADSYGKHLFVRFDDGRSLHAHLLMTGSFAVGRASKESEWRRRIELWFPDGRLTGEAVPILGMMPTRDEHTITDHLGPDLCAVGAAPDPNVVAERLGGAVGEPLSGAMLDQRLVAGWGNVYVNDVPFICGVNPFQPIDTIGGLADLAGIGIALIRTNADRGPQNTTGRRLATDARWMHGVGRRPCPYCGDRLEYRSESQTPWRRSVTWCATCQPTADRVTVDLRRARRLIGLHPAVKMDVFPAGPGAAGGQVQI